MKRTSTVFVCFLLTVIGMYSAGYGTAKHIHTCPPPPIPTVRYIQSVMAEHGYYDGPQDGILGTGTLSGLREMSADVDREDNNKTAIELSGGVYDTH